MNKNIIKKSAVVLSILSLLLITTGVTISFFNYAKDGMTTNKITAGAITFHYQEVEGLGHGISITDALPVDDNDDAKEMDKAFNFYVTSKTIKKVEIPYTITARLGSGADEVMGNIVDVYLTEVNGNNETPTDLFKTNLPKYNELEQYDKVAGYTEKIIYEGIVPANTANYRKDFKLRMWVDENAKFNKQCIVDGRVDMTITSETACTGGTWDYPYNGKTFSVTININAEGKAESPAKRLAAAIKVQVDGGENPTGGLPIQPVADVDLTDPDGPNNNCDPTTDPTCHTCDPSTDNKCSVNNKKRDKCTNYTNGVCKVVDEDDNGDGEDEPIYYYRGGNIDNYVKFGDSNVLWRIVRINGDGTIRIVRTEKIDTPAPLEFNPDNTNFNNSYYSNSTLKNELDLWYKANILANDLDKYVASGNHFCEEFKVAPYPTFVPDGYTVPVKVTDGYSPSYTCNSNKLVNAKIGLITYDEYIKSGNSFYSFLPNSTGGWTMSPAGYNNSVFEYAFTNSDTTITTVPSKFNVYPVINLKADVTYTGTGKIDDPYVIIVSTTPADTRITLRELVMADNQMKFTNPTLAKTSKAARENGLYKINVTDGFGGADGTTYIFRGNVTNNVVEFADKIWRIIRINEDGTIRLILEGSTIDWQTNTSGIPYNSAATTVDDLYYTNTAVNGAKKNVDDWYNANITGDDDAKIASGNYFCEAWKVQRNPTSNYAGIQNLYDSSYDNIIYTPDLKCQNDVNNHGLVSGKVGLITYDESVYAGATFGTSNYDRYLVKDINGNTINYYWWTMTPAQDNIAMWDEREYLGTGSATSSRHFRPVINLKANTLAIKDQTTGHYIVD